MLVPYPTYMRLGEEERLCEKATTNSSCDREDFLPMVEGVRYLNGSLVGVIKPLLPRRMEV
jgi:hypothetical protein